MCNHTVVGVEAIVFSVITADFLVLLASDLAVWIVLLTVILGLFPRDKECRWLFLNKLFYLREVQK